MRPKTLGTVRTQADESESKPVSPFDACEDRRPRVFVVFPDPIVGNSGDPGQVSNPGGLLGLRGEGAQT